MEEQNIRRLLSKHANGLQLSPEEQRELEAWYDAFDEHEELTFFSEADRDTAGSEIKQAIFSRIGMEVPVEEPVQKRKFMVPELLLRVAAALLILMAAGGTWIWFSNRAGAPEPVKYISVMAPYGTVPLLVHLPDSSLVWLHPGSRLKYPEHFAASEREVTLVDGIAFFDVKHNKQAAFIVYAAGGLRTEVLGTQFNIKDYRDMPEAEVTLLKGSVQVYDTVKSLGLLRPNQQIRFKKARGTGNLYEVNPARYTSWLQGNTVLENAAFEEVAKALKDTYNITVVYNPQELSSLRFNIQFSKTTPLQKVLQLLEDISNVRFNTKGRQVTATAGAPAI